jgi:hypothetical protein
LHNPGFKRSLLDSVGVADSTIVRIVCKMCSGNAGHWLMISINRGSTWGLGSSDPDVTWCTKCAPIWCSEVLFWCIGSVRKCFSKNGSGGFLLGSAGELVCFCKSFVCRGLWFDSPRLQSPKLTVSSLFSRDLPFSYCHPLSHFARIAHAWGGQHCRYSRLFAKADHP